MIASSFACSAAILARSTPEALPEPIIAMPVSDITVRTSAKSTLIMPGSVMISAMPATAPCSTSFAALNASCIVTSAPSTSISLSFGITISESTYCDRASMPSCATRTRLRSKVNGLVTTAMVRIPISLAISATTGAAPVPVPPPMPAVRNSMSAPRIASAMRSRSSSAACRPMSGFAPAPRPLVSALPRCNWFFDWQRLSACASVLAQMNSTPCTPLRTMWSTALPPQPPTPITLITAS